MLDKWYWWTDRRLRPFTGIYSQERLTTDPSVANLAAGEKIANPCGVTAWPDPVWPVPPREHVARSRSNLVQYAVPPRGGHFPMIEEPQLYIDDLRQFRRALVAPR